MGRHKNKKPEGRDAIARAECGQHGKLKAFSEAAQALRDGRVVDDTKYQYTKKIEAMKRWCHENYEDTSTIFDNRNEFLLPVQADVALNFFGDLTTKFDNVDLLDEINSDFLKEAIAQNRKIKGLKKAVKTRKQKAAYSFSQVRGFESALAWYHRMQGLSEKCDKTFAELLDGYKWKIANLKATGKMDL